MPVDLTSVQPKPAPGLRDLDLSAWVAADLLHRYEQTGEAGLDQIADAVLDAASRGEAKYGSRLHALNGRNPAIDAFQETRDQIQYLYQLAVEWDLVNRRQAELLAVLATYEAFIGQLRRMPEPHQANDEPFELRAQVTVGQIRALLAAYLRTSLPDAPIAFESPSIAARHEELVRAAVEAERERCAEIADRHAGPRPFNDFWTSGAHIVARLIAKDIRAG